MGVMRRKDLRPAKRVDDVALLRSAQASATRAANRRAREARAEATLRSLDEPTRANGRTEAGDHPPGRR